MNLIRYSISTSGLSASASGSLVLYKDAALLIQTQAAKIRQLELALAQVVVQHA